MEPSAAITAASFHPALYQTPRRQNTEPRTRMCHFVDFEYNHECECYKLLAGRIMYSHDVTWNNPEVPLVAPMGVLPTDPPGDIYVPVPKPVSVNATPPSPPPAPAPVPVTHAHIIENPHVLLVLESPTPPAPCRNPLLLSPRVSDAC